MASIFLSYARDDGAKAKALAKALERAGHSVWWDRNIHGGSEFSGEIEAALRDADVVVVLWSQTSLKSAWVRDEAAEGRDSGRLVPLLLDHCSPPLGFRQLQLIGIAGWSGRGNPPEFQTILAAIAARSGSHHRPEESGAKSTAGYRRLALAGFTGLAAILLAIGAWWLIAGSRSAAAQTPVLAVLPFSDLSPQSDKAYLAEGVAEAILTVLAKEPGIKVIGRSSAKQLHDSGSEAPNMRRAMGITHVLEGSARSIGDQLRMSVRLINASDGQQIWAEEYQRRLDNIFAVQDEIGQAVARRLRGSFGSAAASAPITKADVYALYLAARSRIQDRRTSALQEALQDAKRVIEADPDYAPGHALYAEIINHLSIQNYGTLPAQRARQIAERHARKAIQLAPDLADGHAVLGLILENEAAIEPLKRAIALDPARAEVRHWLGHAYNSVGRHEEALNQFQSTLEMEPLWGPAISMVAYTLAASERYDEAETRLAQFERRGGKAAVANKIRGDIANYRGDYSEAVRLTNLALKQDPETPQADLSGGWFYFLLGLHDEASRVSARLPRYSRLVISGQQDRLIQEVRATGAGVWKQPEPGLAIESLAIARDWATITALYDANRSVRSAVCRDPERLQLGINLAAALKMTGRARESRELLVCVRKSLTLHGRGPIHPPYLPAASVDLLWAGVRAIEDRGELVLPLLNRSVDRGTRTPFGRGMDDFPIFDQFKDHPGYAKIDARLKRLIAQERAETRAWKPRAA